MNQVPIVPVTPINPYPVQQACTPSSQPNYNAVKIEINNPSVATPCGQTQYNPQYAQPTMPYYTYPQAPIYTYPTAQQPMPQPYIPAMPMPCPQPEAQPSVVPQPAEQVPAEPVAPTVPVAPANAPVVNQQNINVPQPVPVVVTNNQPIPVTVSKPAEAAQVPTQESKPADVKPVETENKPEVVPSEPVSPAVDLNSFIAKLADPDFDVQAATMEQIADLVKNEPQKATELVDTKVFDALANIINFDSSKLEGPTAEQTAAREKVIANKEVTEQENALANTITPKEQAERNKSFALFTTAIMQKLYADEVKKLSGTTVPLTELPNASLLVDQLKNNPNPIVRASAIDALSYLQNPDYKKDLETVFTVAKNDQQNIVSETATSALDKLNAIVDKAAK